MNPRDRQQSYEQSFGGAERFSLSPSDGERFHGPRKAALCAPEPEQAELGRDRVLECASPLALGKSWVVESARGLAHSKTLRWCVRFMERAGVRGNRRAASDKLLVLHRRPTPPPEPPSRSAGWQPAVSPTGNRRTVPTLAASADCQSATPQTPSLRHVAHRPVPGFKARNFLSGNSRPDPLSFRRGEGSDCGKGVNPTNLSVKPHPSQPSLAGFTLIELVISAALGSMILVSAYLCLSSAIASRKLIEPRVDVLQSARIAMAIMTADLRAACPLSKDFQFLGMARKLGEVEADNLDFATHNYTPHRSREGDYCQVSIFLEKDPRSGQFILWRRRNPIIAPDPLSGGAREEIARGLRGVQFEYYDGFDWYDSWGEIPGAGKPKSSLRDPSNLSGMPEAVRITLAFDLKSSSKVAASAEPATAEPPLVFRTIVRLNLAASSLPGGSGNDDSSVPAPDGSGPAPGRGVN